MVEKNHLLTQQNFIWHTFFLNKNKQTRVSAFVKSQIQVFENVNKSKTLQYTSDPPRLRSVAKAIVNATLRLKI